MDSLVFQKYKHKNDDDYDFSGFITIRDDFGRIKSDVKKIIDLIRDNDMILCTGHLDADDGTEADEIVEEAKKLEHAGLDQIKIVDSAGTMMPDEVGVYTKKLSEALSIPVAFHGHNNLGLSAANAIAAYKNGVEILDCGLMGMARSAGNLPTEVCVAMMQRIGEFKEINFINILNFIGNELQPAMENVDM